MRQSAGGHVRLGRPAGRLQLLQETADGAATAEGESNRGAGVRCHTAQAASHTARSGFAARAACGHSRFAGAAASSTYLAACARWATGRAAAHSARAARSASDAAANPRHGGLRLCTFAAGPAQASAACRRATPAAEASDPGPHRTHGCAH